MKNPFEKEKVIHLSFIESKGEKLGKEIGFLKSQFCKTKPRFREKILGFR